MEQNQGSGFGVRNRDWGREHETKRISEHETHGGTGSGMGIGTNKQDDKTGDNGPNWARPEDHRRLHAGHEAQLELGR